MNQTALVRRRVKFVEMRYVGSHITHYRNVSSVTVLFRLIFSVFRLVTVLVLWRVGQIN